VLEANPPLQRLHAENIYRYLVGGHTHARMIRQFDHLTIINAGTLRRERSPGFLLADFAAGQVQEYLWNNAGKTMPGALSTLPQNDETENER